MNTVRDAAFSGSAPIAVVGSANLDIVVGVPRHPRVGETVLGGDHRQVLGGKGANQAVAAARLGSPTAFVGAIGDDDPGVALQRGLADNAVDLRGLRVIEGTPSGIALIVVAEDGENTIVVSPGANARLTAEDLASVGETLAGAAATLVQLEVPLDVVSAAVEAAGGLVVCNPAPAAALPRPLLEGVDVLVPNRVELAELAGVGDVAEALDDVASQARLLDGPSAVVVTLGSEGCLVVDAEGTDHVPPLAVQPVDTTAAGDAFCAALTVRLVAGEPLRRAAAYANVAAALATTRPGAQPSLPTIDEVDAAMPGDS